MSNLKTEAIEIDNKVVKLRQTVIAVSNISEVSTFVPQPKFPVWAVVALLFGLVLMFAEDTRMLGIICLAVGAMGICAYYHAQTTAPKGITIRLNSGSVFSIRFSDHELANKVMTALEKAMQTERVVQTFNLPNATIKNSISNSTILNSQIGNIGGFIKNGK